MKNKAMGLRLVRGGALGIIIGIVAGIGIPTALNWENIMENKEEIIDTIGERVIETFSYVDLYDETTGEEYEENIYGHISEVGEDRKTAAADCSSLEDVILRFHVRANSNSDEDIALKLAVRDAVLISMGDKLGNIGTTGRDEVLTFLEENLEKIEDIAENVIKNNGYDYEVNAYISDDYFPIRQYGELTIPAGTYTALRIDIGNASGENFWCLLYPTMCYTVDSEAFVSKEGEDSLRQELTEEDYDRLFVNKDLEKGQLKIKFKIFEWLGL
jgi:stage II sporulation protein R